MMAGDVFQCRIGGSIPLIWQYWSGSPRLLCAVPSHQCDTFPVVQEWQRLSDGKGQALRLDFLHYLPLPAGPNTHHAANLQKLKAALSIENNVNLVREVSIYYTIDKEQIYDLTRRTQILMSLGFFRGSESSYPTVTPLRILRVRVPELISDMQTMSPDLFSNQALRELQNIKYHRHQRQQIQGRSKIVF